MNRIFIQGRELIEIIQGHDWLLYDVTASTTEQRAFTWKELQETSPARQLAMGGNYLFVPRPQEGQTLREGYSITKGLGPCLTIKDPNDDRWMALRISRKKIPGHIALFSRLFFEDDYVLATSPSIPELLPGPDLVKMPYGTVVSSFRESFRIITPEELGLKTPII